VQIDELIDLGTAIVSVAAAAAFLMLLPLYLSQRRDVQRLRAWMEREPDHPPADLAASEALLDRAETELEEILGATAVRPPDEAAPVPTPAGGVTPTTPLPPARRVTSERPALERITMEREALAPHPRWRRFATRATQPRVLVATGIAAVLLGAAAIFGSEQLLTDGEEGPARSGLDPAQIQVAVLNGTTASGLASKVGSDLQATGFDLGAVTNATPGFEQTVVMFRRGSEREARKVAKTLGVRVVQPLGRDDRELIQLAEGADVVVVAGEDRARP
jgi:LytR cell envelope-related transcriptional attenuator